MTAPERKWADSLTDTDQLTNTDQLTSPHSDPNVGLMLQVQQGDAAAFEQLVLRFQPKLLTVLEQFVGNRGQAEDLTQEVFMRVFRSRQSYQPTAKFSTWLYSIAHNVGKNALRRNGRRKEVQLENRADSSAILGVEQLAKEASGLMPQRLLDKAEISNVVKQAVSTLGKRQQMAILLSKFEGMSYQEIADTMDLSLPAIKSLLSRAREKLRSALEPYLGEGQSPTSTLLASPPSELTQSEPPINGSSKNDEAERGVTDSQNDSIILPPSIQKHLHPTTTDEQNKTDTTDIPITQKQEPDDPLSNDS
ncbi:MAG: sigma-70 family RNA polymerase sigma factor [Pirellulaceae bacterium]|nr:sigma-70 family RNA polymerase sigma factor [Pirellulaceae bacterium]